MSKEVKLVAWIQNPEDNWDAEDAAVYGAKGCFSDKSSDEIHQEEIAGIVNATSDKEKAKAIARYNRSKENLFKETSGRGHGAVLDQSGFIFSITNLTRASTLFLCAPEYAAHLQQSMRRTTAERGFHLPQELGDTKAAELMSKQFALYEKMVAAEDIAIEDARFILPLYARTNIQSLWDARELMHLDDMSKKLGVPMEVRDTIQQMVIQATNIAPKLMKDRDTNYEPLSWFPSSQLYAPSSRTIEDLISTHRGFAFLDSSTIPMSEAAIKQAVEERDETELANLKHFHFTYLSPMSLACFHQATRQRSWNQSVQSLESSVKQGEYIMPPSIKGTEFEQEFIDLNEEARDFVKRQNYSGESMGVLSHSLQVYDIIHINGWNAIHSIGKRTCTEAQWEIRKIANKMAKGIKEKVPTLGKYAVPQGIIYGKCPERNSCGICDKVLGGRQ